MAPSFFISDLHLAAERPQSTETLLGFLNSTARQAEQLFILGDLFVGDEYLMRGYSPGSFDVNECTPTQTGSCGEYDRLLGQRIGVVNVEMRIPVLGTERFGLLSFPYLPTDLVGFFDAGMAWNDGLGDDVSLIWDRTTPERVPVFSAGVSARMNLFGALVLVKHRLPSIFDRFVEGA